MAAHSPSLIFQLLLVAIAAGSLASAFPAVFGSMNNKIGGQRKLSISAVVECFQNYNKEQEGQLGGRKKKMYAATSGATAVLYDEDGNEMDCTKFANTKPAAQPHKYDQHCFFSPLNCFFVKYRIQDQGAGLERADESNEKR